MPRPATPAAAPSARARGTQPAAPAAAGIPEDRSKLNYAMLGSNTARWNAATGAYEYVPIQGAPQNNPVTAQTGAGSGVVQGDLVRRQAASAATRPTGPSGQFDSGRIVNDPTANVAAAAGVNPFQGAALTGSPRVTVTANRAPPVAAFSAAPTVSNPSKVEQGATQAGAALGPAPQIDMGLADRQQGTVNSALGLSQQVVNSALAPIDQTGLDASVANARQLLDQMLNGPNTAARIGGQTLRTQLALARSARGGPGAVQAALSNAQQQAPELQAQATQAGTQETLARQAAAGNIVNQLQTTETNRQANETSRINAASGAASGFAQGALGAKGQDIQVAQSNQSAASNLLSDVARLTGTQLELDQRNQELIGQLARDAAAQDFNWAQLSAQQQDAEFERWVKVYGIDQAAAAQIKAAAAANKKGVWDYIVPIIGAAATVGAAAAGKPG